MSFEWHQEGEGSATSALVYAYQYGLDLYSNFTGYLNQQRGDQIFERDRRIVTGAKLSHTFFGSWAGHASQTRIGTDVRVDFVHPGLFNTEERGVYAAVRKDRLSSTGISPWIEQKFSWTPSFRTVFGLRGDLYSFDVQNETGGVSASMTRAIASPKASLVFGPWFDTEFYLSAGLGCTPSTHAGLPSRRIARSCSPANGAWRRGFVLVDSEDCKARFLCGCSIPTTKRYSSETRVQLSPVGAKAAVAA